MKYEKRAESDQIQPFIIEKNLGFPISLRKTLPPVTLRYGSPPSPVGTALQRASVSLTFPLWDTFHVIRLMTLLDTGNLQ